MGQNFIKFKFTSGESADRIRNLKSPDEIEDHLAELKRTLAKPRIQSELSLKIGITMNTNLKKSPIARILYKLPAIVKFRFVFQKLDGQYEIRNLNLHQFYEFYKKLQHFCFILESQKIDPRKTKELIMSRRSQDKIEETKTEAKKTGDIEQRGEIKKYTDITEAQSVFVGEKPVIQQPEPGLVFKTVDSNPENPDGEELVYCVLCFANPVEMLLPCSHGYCEKCCLDWYKVKCKNQCLICHASINDSDFDTKVFLVMSKVKEEEVNASIKQELVAYISSLCRTLKF